MICLTMNQICDTMNVSEWRPTLGQPKQCNEWKAFFNGGSFFIEGQPSPIIALRGRR